MLVKFLEEILKENSTEFLEGSGMHEGISRIKEFPEECSEELL